VAIEIERIDSNGVLGKFDFVLAFADENAASRGTGRFQMPAQRGKSRSQICARGRSIGIGPEEVAEMFSGLGLSGA
jgi:hypothetical protein